MDSIQFTILEQRLKKIEELLVNIQPKPKRLKQTKITDERPFIDQVNDYSEFYAPSMLTDFYNYWSECDRWKKEKVFDIKNRLERWKRQQEKWDWEKSQKQILKTVNETPQRQPTERVDSGFTKISFNSLNKK